MEAWEYEYDLHKHMNNHLSFSSFDSLLSFIYFPCVFGTWIRRCSLQCVESVVRLCHQSVSCVSVLSVLVEMQKCEREMQQHSSCFSPRFLALLMERFSELLLHVV